MTDQSAGQVDTCRPRIGAIDPLGLWKAEKPGACHGVMVSLQEEAVKCLTWAIRIRIRIDLSVHDVYRGLVVKDKCGSQVDRGPLYFSLK